MPEDSDDVATTLWHYTTRIAAEAILEENSIRVGEGSHYGERLGVYATDIPPSDPPGEIAPRLFDGDRDAEDRAQAAVQVRTSWYGGEFVQVESDPHIYKIDGDWQEAIDVPVVDAVAWDGAAWQPLDVY